MKNKLIIAAIVILVIVVAVLSYRPSNGKLVIGAVIPQTGFGAYWGDPVLKGIKLAEIDLKAKYPNNDIVIAIEDSQSNAAKAVTAAQKLLTIDKADALYSEFSGMSSAISPVAKAANKVFVSSAYNQKTVEDNTLSLKTFISFEVACDALGRYVADPSKKILIISAIADSAPYCLRGLEKHFPSENIKVIDGVTGTDFKTLLLQNKVFNPDYIIPMMYEEGAYALIKQKNQMGLAAKIFCHEQDCFTDKILKELAGDYTNGYISFDTPIKDSFVAKIKAAYPEIITGDLQGAANSYQSMMFLGEGLVKCANDKTAECVVKAMGNEKNLPDSAYRGAEFTNRVLGSEISLSVVKDGELVLIK
jgi:ABC-type branched-subunit amino acid transport system substrate-binding protein